MRCRSPCTSPFRGAWSIGRCDHHVRRSRRRDGARNSDRRRDAYAVSFAELRGRNVEFAEDAVRDGLSVTLVEVKDVELPVSMRRAMGRQAEAERERRSKVIHAEGEREAAASLSEAAVVLERSPGAMQLRLLSTMTEVAAERNSTLIFPIPVELLRFLERGAGDTTPELPAGG